MKLLLTQRFQQREPRTPIALMDLAAYGRQFGHEIDVAYDEGQEIDPDYDAVWVSAIIASDAVLNDLDKLRERYKGKILFGGKGVESMGNDEMHFLYNLDVERISGPGEFQLSGKKSIDYATYPAWHAADLEAISGPVAEAMGSRGCPYRCHFCHNTEPRVQWFSPERTVTNATMILQRTNQRRVFFVDDIFALKPSRMMAILDEADRQGIELRRKTQFFVHVNHAGTEQLEAIDAYQPLEMQMGVESGDDGMLQAMGKTFKAALAEDRIRELKRRGHHVACLFLIGFPGETKQSLQNTVDFVKRNRQYMSGWWVSYYQPVRGTVGWGLASERLGREVEGEWNTEVSYLDPAITIEDLQSARKQIMG